MMSQQVPCQSNVFVLHLCCALACCSCALMRNRHGCPDVCITVINNMYGYNAMEVQEAFVKIKEQARAYLALPQDLKAGVEQCCQWGGWVVSTRCCCLCMQSHSEGCSCVRLHCYNSCPTTRCVLLVPQPPCVRFPPHPIPTCPGPCRPEHAEHHQPGLLCGPPPGRDIPPQSAVHG